MQGVLLGVVAAGAAGFAGASLNLFRKDPSGGALSANKSLVRKLYRQVWNERDSEKAKTAAAKFISEDHILIDPRRVLIAQPVPVSPRLPVGGRRRCGAPPPSPLWSPAGASPDVWPRGCSRRFSFTTPVVHLLSHCTSRLSACPQCLRC